VAQNPEGARVLGLDVERMIKLTFVINAVLATAAALLVAPVYLAKFDLGEVLGLKAFFAAIIGGLNQMRGALVGGLLLGVVENFAAAYVSAQYKDAVALALFVIVILFRPEGLVGRVEERKV
jgi:branched-chain amino acid transport system permease protein